MRRALAPRVRPSRVLTPNAPTFGAAPRRCAPRHPRGGLARLCVFEWMRVRVARVVPAAKGCRWRRHGLRRVLRVPPRHADGTSVAVALASASLRCCVFTLRSWRRRLRLRRRVASRVLARWRATRGDAPDLSLPARLWLPWLLRVCDADCVQVYRRGCGDLGAGAGWSPRQQGQGQSSSTVAWLCRGNLSGCAVPRCQTVLPRATRAVDLHRQRPQHPRPEPQGQGVLQGRDAADGDDPQPARRGHQDLDMFVTCTGVPLVCRRDAVVCRRCCCVQPAS